MEQRAYLIHALSPLHAGTGQAADIIDLPIARMRSTGTPIVPGSSVKGVLRDSFRGRGQDDKLWAIFGPPTEDAAEHAGALVVGDARLLALPVRSFKGTFAWVTSPLLLHLAKRDLGNVADVPPNVPDPGDERSALVTETSCNRHEETLYLEELDLPASANSDVDRWASFWAARVSPDSPHVFEKRFAVVDDETMTYLWETATQVDARVRIDPESRTVAKGALWYEESLPPESVLIGVLAAQRSMRRGVELTPTAILDAALQGDHMLQFGGKATVGRGRCRFLPV
jgi:CRISPR-associated protein Cmr4